MLCSQVRNRTGRSSAGASTGQVADGDNHSLATDTTTQALWPTLSTLLADADRTAGAVVVGLAAETGDDGAVILHPTASVRMSAAAVVRMLGLMAPVWVSNAASGRADRPAGMSRSTDTSALLVCHGEDMNTQPAAGRVVDALVSEGLLEPANRDRSRDVVARSLDVDGAGTTQAESGFPKLVEVVAYLGGALVLAAGFLFLIQTWDDLSDTGQVIALLIVALVLGAAGWGAADRVESVTAVRRRLSGTLLTGSALAAGLAVGVAIDASTDLKFDDVAWPVIGGGLVTMLGSALGYRLSSTALGLVGMLGGTLFAAVSLADQGHGDEAAWVGLTFVAVSIVWLALTEAGAFAERTIACALGVSAALFGAQFVLLSGDDLNWLGYTLTTVVAVVGVCLYLTRLDWPYLAAAVIAVTLVVPEAVSDWTDGSLGVVGGVLVAGITLLAASFAGYRLRAEATD
jgi:hypothetical protein